jgi:hypothetical protein
VIETAVSCRTVPSLKREGQAQSTLTLRLFSQRLEQHFPVRDAGKARRRSAARRGLRLKAQRRPCGSRDSTECLDVTFQEIINNAAAVTGQHGSEAAYRYNWRARFQRCFIGCWSIDQVTSNFNVLIQGLEACHHGRAHFQN